MSEEAKVVDIKTVDLPKKKAQRFKLDPVIPTSIVEVWRLVERSIRDGSQNYPDLTEDSPEIIRSHLFQYIQLPTFAGLIARVGRRPVGVVLGHVQIRPFGRPSRFVSVSNFWVDPGFRNQGIGKALWDDYSNKMKKAGIFHWESLAPEGVSRKLVSQSNITQLLSCIGGKL